MATSYLNLLETHLQDWRELLIVWATNGTLSRAAQTALQLEGEPEKLRELVGEWSQGDFRNLPPVVLLPAGDMPGAAGAYAISTRTIYLNQDWLQSANREQALAVLTEELGHHLDGLLNASDTPGDEGELFSDLLTGRLPPLQDKAGYFVEDDSAAITLNTQEQDIEMSAFLPISLPIQRDLEIEVFDPDAIGPDRITLIRIAVLINGVSSGLSDFSAFGKFLNTLYEYKDLIGLFYDLQKTIQQDKSDWELAASREKFIKDLVSISVGASMGFFGPPGILAGLAFGILVDYGITKPLVESITAPLQLFEGYYGKIPVTEALLDGKFDAYPAISELAARYISGGDTGLTRDQFNQLLQEQGQYETFLTIISANSNGGTSGLPQYGAGESSMYLSIDGKLSLKPGSGNIVEDVSQFAMYELILEGASIKGSLANELTYYYGTIIDLSIELTGIVNIDTRSSTQFLGATNNRGIVNLINGSTFVISQGSFSNTGILDSRSGNVDFWIDVSEHGVIKTDENAGGLVRFRGGIHTFNSAAKFTGKNFLADYDATITGVWSNELTFASGTIKNLEISADGIINIDLSASNVSSATLLGVLNNKGTVNLLRSSVPYSGGYGLVFGDERGKVDFSNSGIFNSGDSNGYEVSLATLQEAGSTFNNSGVFNVKSNTYVGLDFVNTGTIANTLGYTLVISQGSFSNTGILDSRSGNVDFWIDVSEHGVIKTDENAGGLVRFRGGIHTFNSAAKFTGKNFLADYDATITGVWSNELTFASGTIKNLEISADGIINIDLSASNVSSATLLGVLNNKGTVNLLRSSVPYSGGYGLVFGDERGKVDFSNSGIFNSGDSNGYEVSLATLQEAGSTFNNSGVFNVKSNTYVGLDFVNTGTIANSFGSTLWFTSQLVNHGIFDSRSASVHFYSDYLQSAGKTIIQEDTLLTLASGTQFLLDGGLLTGNGTINGSIRNSSIINPGVSIGSLVISGNFLQTGTGMTNIEIGGTSNFDSLQISGEASLDGLINILLVNGFVPKLDDSFKIANFTSISAVSLSFSGLRINDALSFQSDVLADGIYLTVVSSSLPKFADISSVTDNVGLIQGVVAAGARTDDTTPTITGTISAALAAGETLRIYNGSTLLGSATVNNTAKTWTYTPTLPATAGTTYNITAQVADAAGNLGTASAARSFIVDTTAPVSTAAITGVNDNAGLIKGIVTAGGRTDDRTPTITGTISAALAAGETLRIYNGAALLGSATVNNTARTWTYTPTLPATAGTTYNITARVADVAGNLGTASAVRSFIVDTTAPVSTAAITAVNDNVGLIQGVVAAGARTDDTTPTITGTISAALATGETLRIFNGATLLGSATVNNTAKTWTYTPTLPATAGTTYNITAQVADAAGNLGTASAVRSFIVDTTAPVSTAAITAVNDNVGLIQGVVAAGARTDDTTPTITGTISAALAAGETLRIYNGSTLLGSATVNNTAKTWTYTPTLPATAGTTYNITAQVADAAGNLGTASAARSFIVDTTAPVSTAAITGVNDNAGLIKGIVTAGGRTDDRTPTITGTISAALAAGETLRIYNGAALLGSATVNNTARTWTYTPTLPATAGTTYNITARVADVAGNLGTASAVRSFIVDTTAPVSTAAITGVNDNAGLIRGTVAAGGRTDDRTPTITGTISRALATGETLRIYNATALLGSATVNNTARTWSYTSTLRATAGTTYRITARVADAAGNLGTASAARSFILDTTPPATTAAITGVNDNAGLIKGIVTVDGRTDDRTPTITGTISRALATGETLRIYNGTALLGSATVNNTARTWSYTPTLPATAGTTYRITARVADGAGNLGTASAARSFILDTTPPATTAAITGVNDNAGLIKGIVTVDGRTDDRTPTITGTISRALATGETLRIYNGTALLGSATVNNTARTWSYTPTLPATAGTTYRITARVADGAGNLGTASAARSFILDTTPPATTAAITGVNDNAGLIRGTVAAGGRTDDRTPTITGTISRALATGETLRIYNATALLGSATVNNTARTWSYTPTLPATAGTTYRITARVADGAGNLGTASTARSFVLDTSIESTISYTLKAGEEILKLTGSQTINGTGNNLDNTIIGNGANNRLTGRGGKDILTGGGGTADRDVFVFLQLSDSLLLDPISGTGGYFDEITDFNRNDRISAPSSVTASRLTTSVGTAASIAPAAIAAVLTKAAFTANSVAAFTASSHSGTFIAMNDGRAGFQADTDSIVWLRNYSISATNFVEFV